MQNQRQFSRILFSTPAQLQIEPRVFDTSIIDLSLKGALVATPDSLGDCTGTDAKLAFSLAESDIQIEMQGVIAHCEPHSIGIVWTTIDIDSMTHLRRLLELNVGNADLLDRQITQLSLD